MQFVLSVGEARGFNDLIPTPRKREYKTFTVDKITGDTFKRTQNFTVQDFDLLRDLLEWFGQPIHTTPHVLSQVSDLIDKKDGNWRGHAKLSRHSSNRLKSVTTWPEP